MGEGVRGEGASCYGQLHSEGGDRLLEVFSPIPVSSFIGVSS